MSSAGIHITLCANDRYFPGLYCTIGSAIKALNLGIPATFHVIDAGLSPEAKQQIESLVGRTPPHAIQWIYPPGGSFEHLRRGKHHISTYYRLALPDLLDVARVIYLDADMLVLSDLSALWEEAEGSAKPACAVKDWETLSLAADSKELAERVGASCPTEYFNAGLLILDLKTGRMEGLTARLIDVLEKFGHAIRFADQSALNYCLARRIHALDSKWNTPAWAFDRQSDNTLPKVLHFTNQAPWLVRRYSPSQAVFERIASDLGIKLPVPEQSLARSVAGALANWLVAPMRVVWHGLRQSVAVFRGTTGDDTSHLRIFRHWLEFFTGGPARCLRYRRRMSAIRGEGFRPLPQTPE